MTEKIRRYEWFIAILAVVGLPYVIIQTSELIEKRFGVEFYHSFTIFIIIIVCILLYFGKEVIIKFYIRIMKMITNIYSKIRAVFVTIYWIIRNIPLIAELHKIELISKNKGRNKR